MIVNQVPVTLTASEKVIVMFAPRATFVAPFAGVVVDTDGAVSPPPPLLSGSGAAGREVDVVVVGVDAPPALRLADVVLVSVRGSTGPLEEVRVAVADKVDDAGQLCRRTGRRASVAAQGGRSGHVDDLPGTRGHCDGCWVDDVRRRKWRADGCLARFLDQEVLAWV